MVATQLLDLDIRDGQEIIERLDAAGVSPVVAFWFFDQGAERWRLALAYPEYDQVGSLPVYKKIHPVIEPNSDVAIFALTVVGLQNDLVKEVRSSFGKRKITPDRPRHAYVRGGEVVVYRV